MKQIFFGLILCGILLSACVKNSTDVVLQSISLSKDTLKMAVGDAVKLSPTFTPSTFSTIAVEWTTSDPTVASVANGGQITALKPGTSWVSVKDKNSATMAKSVVIVK